VPKGHVRRQSAQAQFLSEWLTKRPNAFNHSSHGIWLVNIRLDTSYSQAWAFVLPSRTSKWLESMEFKGRTMPLFSLITGLKTQTNSEPTDSLTHPMILWHNTSYSAPSSWLMPFQCWLGYRMLRQDDHDAKQLKRPYGGKTSLEATGGSKYSKPRYHLVPLYWFWWPDGHHYMLLG